MYMDKICKPNCNPVFNFQQNGVSRKMLISQMIRNGKPINYANSETESIYKTILSLNYDGNKKLLIILKYKLYIKYVNQLISCGKYNSHLIFQMIENIIANLSQSEYNIVFDIIIIVDTNIIEKITIENTFYISVDVNNQFFLIKNYSGEYISISKSYKFNLEDPSNLNSRFCLSNNQSGIPIPVQGLTYNGIPGTPGAFVIFTAPSNISYNVYIFNQLSHSYGDYFSWGYAVPFIPILQAKQIHPVKSYIPFILQQSPNLSVYYYNNLKFLIQNGKIEMNKSSNYNYLFYYGTYYLQVPKIYSIALLNKGQENMIQYTGALTKSHTTSIVGTTNDGTYNFYYDTVIITIYEAFTKISLYSELYGYLGAINSILFSSDAASYAQPEIRNDHMIDTSGIEILYGQTRINVDYSNNRITMNNDTNYTYVENNGYGVYNGTYIFYTNNPIAFLNKGKESIFIVSGLNGFTLPGPDGITNCTFYSGVIQVKILGNFNKMSIFTLKGYCGGLYKLIYNSSYDNHLPHSYSFINTNITTLTDTSIPIYSNYIALNTTDILFTSSYGYSSSKYNIITTDTLNRILFNGIPYNGLTQYTMKNGIYVFFNMSPYFITFMTKNKTESITSEGYNIGVFFTSGASPNGDSYIFNKSDSSRLVVNNVSQIIYLNPIIVTVTNNFLYLSMCTSVGYNGGQNLLYYKI